jgi:Flp pilus assembly protein TadG
MVMIFYKSIISSLMRRLRADRHGATAAVFAIGAVGLFGLVGLATEGGTWYLEKRHGQNAADAAAAAGALALASGATPSAAVTSATSLATSNNYIAGTINGTTTAVAISSGNYSAGSSPPFTASSTSATAIQAIVTRTPPLLFSGLFLSSRPDIREIAVAVVSANGGNACMLAGTGGLSFAGSAQITASNCALASNASGSSGISFGGNKATVSGGTLVSAGGCSNCGNSDGYLLYQPQTTNPYNSIYNMTTGTGMTMPSFTGAHCVSLPTVGSSTTLTPWSSTSSPPQQAYCGTNGNNAASTLSTGSGNVLNFVPGTYFFQDASLTFNGGTVQCIGCTPGGAGVTIVLTGTNANKIGSISIGGNAAVDLNAPVTNDWCHNTISGCTPTTAFDGVLFYMDKIANTTNGNGNAPVSLSGSGTVRLTGGMYFPTVNVTYSGNVSATQPTTACTEIIGYALNVTGNSTLNIAGCAAAGTQVATTKSVQLVQ